VESISYGVLGSGGAARRLTVINLPVSHKYEKRFIAIRIHSPSNFLLLGSQNIYAPLLNAHKK
jgi:hypothetical protein